MNRIINTPMRSEFAFHIFITQQTHFGRKLFAMYSKQTSVQRDWREQSERFGVEACFGADRDGSGEEAGENSHVDGER